MGPNQFDLDLHLSEVSSSFNRRLQIGHRKTSKDGPITDVSGNAIPIGKDGAGSRDQELIVLKPHKNLPRLKLLKAVIENQESRLESVRLTGPISDIRGELRSLVETIGQEDTIARIGGGRRSLVSWLTNRKGYDREDQEEEQIDGGGDPEVERHDLGVLGFSGFESGMDLKRNIVEFLERGNAWIVGKRKTAKGKL